MYGISEIDGILQLYTGECGPKSSLIVLWKLKENGSARDE